MGKGPDPAGDLSDRLFAAMMPVLANRESGVVMHAVLHTAQAVIAACAARGHEAEVLHHAAAILTGYAEAHAAGLPGAEARGRG